jgi:hypothetical protein
MLGRALRQAVETLAKGMASRSAYKFWLKDWLALSDLPALSEALKAMRFSRNLQPLMLEGAVRKVVGIRRGAISDNMRVSFQAARSIG